MILTARRLITADGIVVWPRITVDSDGIVTDIDSADPHEDDSTLAPTFFDIHVHGAAGHDVMEATPQALARVGGFLASHGVGHFLATTVTASIDRTLDSLDGLAACIEAAPASGAAVPVGIHLEGPFLSHAKRGVHAVADLQPPSIPLFERMQQAARGHIRLLTIAPEVPGALDLIAHAASSGVRVSLGHSDATADRARTAIATGATSATHTFNAMRRLDHREPGLAGVVLDDPALFAELICDGIHVAPEFVRLWLRAKGDAHAILVTDGISATGMPDGEYLLGDLTVAVAHGRCLLAADLARGIETLAGSVLTMDSAVANLQRFTGCALETAVRAAGRNPASLLGLPTPLGDVRIGRPANLNRFGPDGPLRETMLHGRALSSS